MEDVVVEVRRKVGVPRLPLPPGVQCPNDVDRARMRLREKEGPQGAPVGVETIGVPPETQEHLLGDVLRF